MNIGFVFGKGIDGCGVTKGACLFEQWAAKQGHNTHILDFNNDVSYFRAKMYSWTGNVLTVSSKEIEVKQEAIDLFNSMDILIIHSLPVRKTFNFVERFRKFLEQINNPIIVMHDHSISQINTTNVPQCGELFSKADILVLQSLEGYSKDLYLSYDRGLENRMIENPIWVDLDFYTKYFLPFEEREKHLTYIGRMSPIKDPAFICRVEPFFSDDWSLSLLGVERSLASISPTFGPFNDQYIKKIKSYRITKRKGPVLVSSGAKEDDNVRITSYDSYKYEEGMSKLSKSLFCWSGYNLKNPKDYGVRMEYTLIESFLCTVPVIHSKFANEAYSPEGKLWKDYYGAVIFEPGKEKEVAIEMEKISKDKDEWTKRFLSTKELIYKFNDINILAPKYLDFILSKGKRENKANVMQKLNRYTLCAFEAREKGEIVVTSKKLPQKRITVLKEGKYADYESDKEKKLCITEGLFAI